MNSLHISSANKSDIYHKAKNSLMNLTVLLNHINSRIELLEDNSNRVKQQVKMNLNKQMEALSLREAWLLNHVDLIHSEKVEVLKKQKKECEHFAFLLEDCLKSNRQGFAVLEMKKMKTNDETSVDGAENRLVDCLDKINALQAMIQHFESKMPFMNFTSDSALLREVISQYGHVIRTYPNSINGGTYGYFTDCCKTSCLPRAMEDEDDEDDKTSIMSSCSYLTSLPAHKNVMINNHICNSLKPISVNYLQDSPSTNLDCSFDDFGGKHDPFMLHNMDVSHKPMSFCFSKDKMSEISCASSKSFEVIAFDANADVVDSLASSTTSTPGMVKLGAHFNSIKQLPISHWLKASSYENNTCSEFYNSTNRQMEKAPITSHSKELSWLFLPNNNSFCTQQNAVKSAEQVNGKTSASENWLSSYFTNIQQSRDDLWLKTSSPEKFTDKVGVDEKISENAPLQQEEMDTESSMMSVDKFSLATADIIKSNSNTRFLNYPSHLVSNDHLSKWLTVTQCGGFGKNDKNLCSTIYNANTITASTLVQHNSNASVVTNLVTDNAPTVSYKKANDIEEVLDSLRSKWLVH